MRRLLSVTVLMCAASVMQSSPSSAQSQPTPTTCRNFTAPVSIGGGKQQQADGTSCQLPDGSLQITLRTPGLPPQVYTMQPPQQPQGSAQSSQPAAQPEADYGYPYAYPYPDPYYWSDPWVYGGFPFFAGGSFFFFGDRFGRFHDGFHHGFHGGFHGGSHGGHR
jgi:hypothetical protein